MPKTEVYTLQVGDEGKQRLSILNRLYNPSTQQLLINSGLRPGMKVLEVGCGTGELACWIATQVSPYGHVVAIDNSSKQLQLAKNIADKLEIKNITFILLSVYDLDQLTDSFDIIFSRWLLAHLLRPLEGLMAMYRRLKLGGSLVSELANLDSSFIYPKNPLLQRWYDVWTGVLKSEGKDIELGYKLPFILADMGCHPVNVALFQPMLSTFEEKASLGMDIKEAAEFIVKNKVATKQEVEQLVADLNAMAYKNIVLSSVRNIQIIGKKSNDNSVCAERNIFAVTTIILARNKIAAKSKAGLESLPQATLLHICSYLNFPSTEMRLRSGKECAEFIFGNIKEINNTLHNQVSPRFFERKPRNSLLLSHSQFSFFPTEPKENDKEVRRILSDQMDDKQSLASISVPIMSKL